MRKLALFLSIVLLLSLIVGCAPSGETTGDPETTPKEATEQPTSAEEAAKDKRILQVSLEGVPDSLDPHVYSGSLSKWGTSPMHGYLITFDEDLNLVPSIAESWDFVSETEITFNLRDDVYFHNGRKLVAQDVKNTLERVLDESVGSLFFSHINAIEKMEVEDDTTITFILEYPYSPILARMTQIPIIPIEDAESFDTVVSGCGAFKFTDYQHDQYIEMERFEDYFEAEKIKIDGIRFTFLPEYNAARTAFLASQVLKCGVNSPFRSVLDLSHPMLFAPSLNAG